MPSSRATALPGAPPCSPSSALSGHRLPAGPAEGGRAVAELGEADRFESPLPNKDERRIDVLLNVTTQRNVQGQINEAVSVGQDITKCREALNESMHVAGDLSLLIGAENAPTFGVDVDGNVTEWDKKAIEIPGHPESETVGSPFVEEFTTEAFKEKVRKVLRRALEGEEEVADSELLWLPRDRRRADILLNVTTWAAYTASQPTPTGCWTPS